LAGFSVWVRTRFYRMILLRVHSSGVVWTVLLYLRSVAS